MGTDNNINEFTALDIEKYHKGLLSTKEMHTLEKAAMDDPFLADALEGYAVAGVNAAADIAELKERLAHKTETSKVIPLQTERKNNFRLLKVAAMLVFVAGAAFAVYQFGFNKKTDAITQNEPVETNVKSNSDTGDSAINTPTTTTTSSDEQTVHLEKSKNLTTTPGNSTNTESDIEAITSTTATASPVKPPAPAPAIKSDENKTLAKEDVVKNNAGIENRENAIVTSKDKTAEKQLSDATNNKAAVANKRAIEQNNIQANNTFRGRVTDENNVGVPFANVTSINENSATYTDADGFFNFTYPDTILNVQVRSIGFDNNNTQLRNTVTDNKIILQENRTNLSEVVVVGYNSNMRSAKQENNLNLKLEENEPTVGWENYDLYLINNIQRPKDFKIIPEQKGEVNLSFEVNKKGQPVNIKVEKSLCTTCDLEAIRLIKEGPKWKQNTKVKRTLVAIPF